MTTNIETTQQLESIKAIETGLAAFDEQKAIFEQLAQSAKDIDVTDVNDKAGLKVLTAKRIELKNARVKVTKEGKSLRDYLNPIVKFISTKEKELVAITEPEEIRLAGREQWVEDELKRIEDENIAAENERIQKRIDQLQQYGYEIDYSDLKSMSDETFDIALQGAKSEWEKEQAEKAEQERLEAERKEQERIAFEAKEAKLAAERKELEELRAKQAEAERIIREQQEETARLQKEAQDKIDAENKRIADEKAAIETEKQRVIDEENRREELRLATEKAAEEARIKAENDAKIAEAQKLEDQRIAKEIEAEKAANAPDKKKIETYIAQLMSVPVPELKTAKSKKITADIQMLMNKVNEFSKEKVTTL